jgi:hypothetical protein
MTSKIFAAINHVQSTPATTWTINHNFINTPLCDVMIDLDGELTKVLPDRMFPLSSTQFRIQFSSAKSGKARLVGEANYTRPTEGAGSVDDNPFAFVGANPYRYYQFRIFDDQGGVDWINIYELELRETQGGVDVTNPLTTVTASSTYLTEGGFPNKVVDDNPNIISSSAGWDSGPASYPVDLTIDLGAGNAKAIVEYTLTNRLLNIHGPNRSPSNWHLRGSNNGTSWTLIDERTGITNWTSGQTKTFTIYA